jgi:hypothetical protein
LCHPAGALLTVNLRRVVALSAGRVQVTSVLDRTILCRYARC